MKNPKTPIKFLTDKDIRQVIEALPDDRRGIRDRALMEVLFSTGLRISECLALDKKPFKFAVGDTFELTIVGKGGFQRTIYFSPPALEAVRKYLSLRQDDDPRLFTIGVRNVQKMVKSRAKDAGLDKFISPHVFRHSLATDLLRKGVDIRVVAGFLGHRGLSNVMRYTWVTSPQLMSIHKKLYGNKK